MRRGAPHRMYNVAKCWNCSEESCTAGAVGDGQPCSNSARGEAAAPHQRVDPLLCLCARLRVEELQLVQQLDHPLLPPADWAAAVWRGRLGAGAPGRCAWAAAHWRSNVTFAILKCCCRSRHGSRAGRRRVKRAKKTTFFLVKNKTVDALFRPTFSSPTSPTTPRSDRRK